MTLITTFCNDQVIIQLIHTYSLKTLSTICKIVSSTVTFYRITLHNLMQIVTKKKCLSHLKF